MPMELYREIIEAAEVRGPDIRNILPSAIELAEYGDVGLLRATLATLHPGIARFVNLPKLKRGEHWPVHELSLDAVEDMDRVATAAGDVARIRMIWREHYGKRRRRPTDGWAAEKFAALRWCNTDPNNHGVDPNDPDIDALETQIVNHMKKRKPIVTDDVIVMKKSRGKARGRR